MRSGFSPYLSSNLMDFNYKHIYRISVIIATHRCSGMNLESVEPHLECVDSDFTLSPCQPQCHTRVEATTNWQLIPNTQHNI